MVRFGVADKGFSSITSYLLLLMPSRPIVV